MINQKNKFFKIQKIIYPLVSIIIPNYNKDRFLSKCLNSCLKQTYKNIEIICIDDNSTDNSFNIIQQFALKDNRIKVFRNNSTKLAGQCRNFGITKSKGEYVLFIDSDDFCDENLVKKCILKILKTNAEICLFKMDSYYPDDDKYIKTEYTLKANYITGDTFSINNNINIFNISTPSPIKLFKKSLIIKNNLQFSEKLHNSEDVVFTIMAMCLATKITYINEFLYHYTQLPNIITTNKTRNEYYKDSLKSFLQLKKHLFSNLSIDLRKEFLKFLFNQIYYARRMSNNILLYQKVLNTEYKQLLDIRGFEEVFKFNQTYLSLKLKEKI